MANLRQAAEMALEALNWYIQEDDVIESMAGNEPWVEGKRNAENAIQALRQALAETDHFRDATKKTEPVAYVHLKEWLDDTLWPEDAFSQNPHEEMTPLYTAPPKKEWFGLSDEEKYDVLEGATGDGGRVYYDTLFRSYEAKLKEKNCG